MANFKYFADVAGETAELEKVYHDGNGKFRGVPVGKEMTYSPVTGWQHNFVEATRSIRMKSNPIRHDCDARCFNATGRTMQCECSCGGKNHGRGAFSCN